MTRRDAFDRAVAVVSERWPFRKDDLENDFRRDLWRLMCQLDEETSAVVAEVARELAGDPRQFGRPAPSSVVGRATERTRYDRYRAPAPRSAEDREAASDALKRWRRDVLAPAVPGSRPPPPDLVPPAEWARENPFPRPFGRGPGVRGHGDGVRQALADFMAKARGKRR